MGRAATLSTLNDAPVRLRSITVDAIRKRGVGFRKETGAAFSFERSGRGRVTTGKNVASIDFLLIFCKNFSFLNGLRLIFACEAR